LDEKWLRYLEKELEKDYLLYLSIRIKDDRKKYRVYPEEKDVLNVLNNPFDNIKCVILGQDPYHNGVAHGYAFSSSDPTYMPPSLRNIFKEIESDLGIKTKQSSDLLRWVEQGVFLLNTSLTVKEGLALSHVGIGWEIFTNKIIKTLNSEKEHLVFMLWGNKAKTYTKFIDEDKHLILTSAHPASELYGRGGFFDCHHFSKCNSYLKQNGIQEINWE
jgi:uracil-DNA glycosylase